MRISQSFLSCKKTESIDQIALKEFLRKLYNNKHFYDEDKVYLESPRQDGAASYKARAKILINSIANQPGLGKFKDLTGKLTEQEVSPGSTRNTVHEIRTLLEEISYRLNTDSIRTKQKFLDALKGASLNVCEAGIASNMQTILHAMNFNHFSQKYDLIKALANEYIKLNNMSPNTNGEIHVVEELLYEVSEIYHLGIKNSDVHARYRDFSANPTPQDFIKHFEFRQYLVDHFNSRKGAYSLAESTANNYMSLLPEGESFPTYNIAGTAQGDEMENIASIVEDLGLGAAHITNQSDDGETNSFKEDYLSIIKVAVIQKLKAGGMVDYEPLKIGGNEIIESPDGWYLMDPKNGVSYTKILDTHNAHDLTLGGKNLEDILHDGLEYILHDDIKTFHNSLRSIIPSYNHNDQGTNLPLTELFVLLSDQRRELLEKDMSEKEVSEIDPQEFRKWIEFLNIKNDRTKAVKFALKYDNLKMLNKLFQNANEMSAWRGEGNLSIFKIAAILNKLKIFEFINPYSTESEDHFALHGAAHIGHKKIIELLLNKNGINVNVINPHTGLTALHEAVQSGKAAQKDQIEIVKLLLENGANVNAANNDGHTSLFVAAQKGHKEIVELLLSKNDIDVNAASNNGHTSLIVAAGMGHTQIVDLLLKKDGINVNAASKDHITSLHVAAQKGHKEIVELLLKKDGIDVNAASKDRYTSLHVAALNGHKKIVELLLENGANVDAAANNGTTSLFIAAQKGHKEIVDLLLKNGANVHAANKNGITSLYVVAQEGHKEIVELLLKKDGINVNAANKNGITSLYVAAQEGHKEIVELLLEKSANVNAANNNGHTSLYVAAQEGHKEIVELLIKNGANVNAANNNGHTSLHVAAEKGHKEIVELLLSKNGIDVNAASKDRYTSLHVAAQNGHKEIVQLLIKKGAKYNTADNNLETALIIAILDGDKKTVELLLSKNGIDVNAANNNRETALMIAAQNGHTQIVELLIKNGAKFNTADNNLETALFVAAIKGRKEIVKLLINNGVKFNTADNNLEKALMMAILHGDKETVELLIKKGANVNAANNNGLTSLFVAAAHGHTEIVELLLSKNGINVNAANNNGYTSLLIAALTVHTEIVKLLFEEGANVNVAAEKGHAASSSSHGELLAKLINLEKYTERLLRNKDNIHDDPDLEIYKLLDEHLKPAQKNLALIEVFKKGILKDAQDLDNIKKVQSNQVYSPLSNDEAEVAMILSGTKELTENPIVEKNADGFQREDGSLYIPNGSSSSTDVPVKVNKYKNGFLKLVTQKVEEPSSTEAMIEDADVPSNNAGVSSSSSSVPISQDDLDMNPASRKRSLEDSASQGDGVKAARLEHSSSNSSPLQTVAKALLSSSGSVNKFHQGGPNNMAELLIEDVKAYFNEDNNNQPAKNEAPSSTWSFNYLDMTKFASSYFKAADSIMDGFKFISEPTLENSETLVRDYINLASMSGHGNVYLWSVSAIDIAHQLSQGELTKALTLAGTTAGYALLPMMLGTSIAPLCSTAVVGYTLYNTATNLYSFSVNHATLESKLKSDIAYAKLYDYFGFTDAAKDKLIHAMNIVQEDQKLNFEQDQCSKIQQIAQEHNLAGMLLSYHEMNCSDCNI